MFATLNGAIEIVIQFSNRDGSLLSILTPMGDNRKMPSVLFTISDAVMNEFSEYTYVTLFEMGLLGAGHRWVGGGAKSPPPPLYNLSHISYIDGTWHSYTLPKEDPKIQKSSDTPLKFC